MHSSLHTRCQGAGHSTWKQELPSFAQLLRTPFGLPDSAHSFTKVPRFNNIAYDVLNSGLLDFNSFKTLCEVHPLFRHLAVWMICLTSVDFRSLRDYDKEWSSVSAIPPGTEHKFLALLFHYHMNLSAVVRFLGPKFLGGHRNIDEACRKMAPHVKVEDIAVYRRIMTVGCPARFVAETSHENAEIYRLHGSDSSLLRHKDLVTKNMLKEHKHSFAFPLPRWVARFCQHIFLTPNFVTIPNNPAKSDRQIFNAKDRPCPEAIPINMMTSTAEGSELDCLYGTVPVRFLRRLWNLRITYPQSDIVIHANDVKSCFRQIKHHPDIVGAFSYVIFNHLWIQIGCTFGSDFSPANWEGVRRVIEQLAKGLFQDKSLRIKHRKYLDKLQWDDSLDSARPKRFVPAFRDSKNQGVLDAAGNPEDTPHDLFVDDDIYAEVYLRERVEQAIACSIEAMFICLGESDLTKRQDPISWDKLVECIISHFNKVLGLDFNTRKMDVGPPPEFVARTLTLLDAFHEGRKAFLIKEMSSLVGHLSHIGTTSRWLPHVLSHLYTSITAALKNNRAYEIESNKAFRLALKEAEANEFPTSRHKSYNEGFIHRTLHSSKKQHFLNATAIQELHLIRSILRSKSISLRTPIAHLVERDPTGVGHSDSSLDAAGGWSTDCSFWWYLEWSDEIRRATLRFHRKCKDRRLISINVLEYASLIINYAAMSLYYRKNKDPSNPFPIALLYADNVAAEIWCMKGCKRSMLGRALGRLLCALMLNNPLGLSTARVTTKDNFIADEISRLKSEKDSLSFFVTLVQSYPQLRGCNRFLPSQELLSALTEALLTGKIVDPVKLNKIVLANPGSFTT